MNSAAYYSVVGGGWQNEAAGDLSTVAGGGGNQSRGVYATVAGGAQNEAAGFYSMIPGGIANLAQGDYSFAAGRGAQALHDGTFVWADSGEAMFSSTGPDQFLIHASGGVEINMNAPGHPLHVGRDATNGNGAHVTAGGVWTNGSDRNSKRKFEALDKGAILAKALQLPVAKWQCKGEGERIRHIGPTAQDFYAAFGLGASDKHIGTIDADGVALAAIQGLYDIVKEQAAEIGALRADRDAEIVELAARVAALEKLIGQLDARREGGARFGHRHPGSGPGVQRGHARSIGGGPRAVRFRRTGGRTTYRPGVTRLATLTAR